MNAVKGILSIIMLAAILFVVADIMQVAETGQSMVFEKTPDGKLVIKE